MEQPQSTISNDIAEAYINAVKKTGFVLENSVANILKKHGWTTISNKYYEDDHSTTVREVDLIAYKIRDTHSFSVCTAIIISCKKSDENAWAFMCREINENDPNVDWWPLHIWTNDKIIDYQKNLKRSAKDYHNYMNKAGVDEILRMPEVDVFAFQELSKATKPKTGGTTNFTSSPKNDTAIFNSITSLMKAQAYEIGALTARKTLPYVYQFNLVTVADTELLRLKFDEEKISCHQTNNEHYIGRYIINRKETFSRIHFIASDSLEDQIVNYNKLHDANITWFTKETDEFYKTIFEENKQKISLAILKKSFGSVFSYLAHKETLNSIEIDDVSLRYDNEKEILKILINASEEDIIFLNRSKDMNDYVKRELKINFRYQGKFRFEQLIVF
ncbi:hypothetical protein ACF8PL_26815 [Delftia sp. WSY_4]|uniref:hypothetical protein n=1 Tax=unclassified Delftia TaxID=2613839 RepID=UPI00370BDE3B